jgi:hypothetical protein
MIKHIITTALIAALAIAIVPSKIQALDEVPVTTMSREMLFPKLKWSQACQDKFLYNLAVDNVMPNDGIKFYKITNTYYLLQVQCDQMFSEVSSQGTYEFLEVLKFGTELYPRPIMTFKSQYMNSLGKYIDYERTQITGNPVVTTTPIGISNFEPFNFNDIAKPMGKMLSGPNLCGVFEDFRVQKKVKKPTMKAITVNINNTCPEFIPTPEV